MEKIFSTHCSLPKQLQWPGQKQKPRDSSGSPLWVQAARSQMEDLEHKLVPTGETSVVVMVLLALPQCWPQHLYIYIYIYKIKKIYTHIHTYTHICVCIYICIYIHIYLILTSSEKCNKILASLACSHCLPACIPQTKNASNKIMNFS